MLVGVFCLNKHNLETTYLWVGALSFRSWGGVGGSKGSSWWSFSYLSVQIYRGHHLHYGIREQRQEHYHRCSQTSKPYGSPPYWEEPNQMRMGQVPTEQFRHAA